MKVEQDLLASGEVQAELALHDSATACMRCYCKGHATPSNPLV